MDWSNWKQKLMMESVTFDAILFIYKVYVQSPVYLSTGGTRTTADSLLTHSSKPLYAASPITSSLGFSQGCATTSLFNTCFLFCFFCLSPVHKPLPKQCPLKNHSHQVIWIPEWDWVCLCLGDHYGFLHLTLTKGDSLREFLFNEFKEVRARG